MSYTKEEIIKMINLDEPDYPVICGKLSESSISILIELVNDPNSAIATKAISCLGFMKTPSAVAGIEIAVKSKNPILRLAAAHSLKNLSSQPNAVKLINKLLDDKDVGVRKFALKTVSFSGSKSFKAKIEKINFKETNTELKNMIRQIIDKL
jgi:HEAT repeat protein